MINSFRETTEEERLKLEKKRKQGEELAKQALEQAEKCLKHPDFVKYRLEYKDAVEKLIEYLVDYTETGNHTIETYAFEVRDALVKIGHMRYLLRLVEGDYARAERNAKGVSK